MHDASKSWDIATVSTNTPPLSPHVHPPRNRPTHSVGDVVCGGMRVQLMKIISERCRKLDHNETSFGKSEPDALASEFVERSRKECPTGCVSVSSNCSTILHRHSSAVPVSLEDPFRRVSRILSLLHIEVVSIVVRQRELGRLTWLKEHWYMLWNASQGPTSHKRGFATHLWLRECKE